MWLMGINEQLSGGTPGKSLAYVLNGCLTWYRGAGSTHEVYRAEVEKFPTGLSPTLNERFIRFPPPEK